MKKIKKSLSEMPGVRSVETNSETGSVLVTYDPANYRQFGDSLAEHAATQNLFAIKPPELTEVDEIADKIEAEAEFLAEHSHAARAVVDLCKELNQEVKQATKNSVDLKVLIPLGLAVYLLLSEDPSAATPLWVTLGIFSFNSFVALHTASPKPAAANQAIGRAKALQKNNSALSDSEASGRQVRKRP